MAQTETECISREEKRVAYYDDVYKAGYNVDHMRPVYDEIMLMLFNLSTKFKQVQVLEIGCGIGVFGKMVAAVSDFRYRGFDFSVEAIRRCPNEIRTMVARRDAYHRSSYRLSHNIVIAIEVMEHLDDLEVLTNIKRDTICIFTLPNYTDEAHLRTYENARAIKKYYKGWIRWHKIVPIEMADDEGIECGKKIIHVCKGVRL